jgi:hypothetical protein
MGNVNVFNDPYTLATLVLIGISIFCKVMLRLPWDIWFIT